MEVPYKTLAVLIALSVVCLLSMIGSTWLWLWSEVFGDYNTWDESAIHRWKWMLITTIVITVVLLLVK